MQERTSAHLQRDKKGEGDAKIVRDYCASQSNVKLLDSVKWLLLMLNIPNKFE